MSDVYRFIFYVTSKLYEERQIFCKPILVLSLSGVYDDVNDHHFLLNNARVTPLNSEYFQGRHSLSLMTQILHFMYSALQFIYALDVTQPCIIFRNKPDYPSFLQCLQCIQLAIQCIKAYPDHLCFLTSFVSFQVNEKEAIWISLGVFGFSAGISIPFIIFTKLQRMFYEPGAYDHIAFCVEDLSQQAQVGFSNIFQVFPIFS